MNVYFCEKPERTTILHFGLGMIGQAIFEELKIGLNIRAVYHIPFLWNEAHPNLTPLDAFFSENSAHNAPYLNKMIVIWSSGIHSMTSALSSMDQELQFFKSTMYGLGALMDKFHTRHSQLLLISSAGGLYEGQVCVLPDTQSQPLTWYGISKLQQEAFVTKAGIFEHTFIFRPSSVYSIDNFKNRKGLINTIFFNAIFNRTTTVYGNPGTLRDYVLDRDIGRHIVQNVLLRNPNPIHTPQNLVSGKPYSIFELKNIIERILGKPLYVAYASTNTNAKHITFKPSGNSSGFNSSDLVSNLHKLKSAFFTVAQKKGI